jgi:hypothetical protein
LKKSGTGNNGRDEGLETSAGFVQEQYVNQEIIVLCAR